MMAMSHKTLYLNTNYNFVDNKLNDIMIYNVVNNNMYNGGN